MDLECAIDDWFRLSDQLVQPLFDDRAVAALVNVQAVGRAWRLPVDRHAKTYRGFLSQRTHDEMKVARVKAVHDPPIRIAKDGGLPPHRPFASQGPLIERQTRGDRIDATTIQVGTATRCEVLRSIVADVGFRRSSGCPNQLRLRRPSAATDTTYHREAGDARFGEQPLNGGLRSLVLALAEVMLSRTRPRASMK